MRILIPIPPLRTHIRTPPTTTTSLHKPKQTRNTHSLTTTSRTRRQTVHTDSAFREGAVRAHNHTAVVIRGVVVLCVVKLKPPAGETDGGVRAGQAGLRAL